MKKKQKKLKKKNKTKTKKSINKKSKKPIKLRKKSKINLKKKIKRTRPKNSKTIRNRLINNVKKDTIALKLVKWQLSLKPEFKFRINFSLEKYIQSFFDKA